MICAGCNVQPIGVGVIALVVPPGTVELLGTITPIMILISVIGRELHAVHVVKSSARKTCKCMINILHLNNFVHIFG